MTKVLFALTSHDRMGDTDRKTGAYAPEFTHPAKVFAEAGYDIDFVSVAGGRPPLDGLKADDTITNSFLADPVMTARLNAAKKPTQIDPADYDAIFYAGGHGTMWDFPTDTTLAAVASAIYGRGGVVAAVCHGPAGLLPVTGPDGSPIVAGKAISSFTNEEEADVGLDTTVPFLLESALISQGALHKKGVAFREFAIADERLVSGQNPASATKVAQLIVEILDGQNRL
jgi:putative intracellular protease/amidase